MDQCSQKILTKSKRSSNYYSIYEKKNELEFELEMKNKVVKSVQEFLFLNHMEEFKDKLSKHFYRHSMDSLILDN